MTIARQASSSITPQVIQAHQIFMETEKTNDKLTCIFLLPGR
jgi:hypothetical protein